MINDFYCGLPGTSFFVYLGICFWDCLQRCKMKKLFITFTHTFVIFSGRIVSIVVVEVTLLHDEHITSLLSSKKKDRRKARLQLAGIKF